MKRIFRSHRCDVIVTSHVGRVRSNFEASGTIVLRHPTIAASKRYQSLILDAQRTRRCAAIRYIVPTASGHVHQNFLVIDGWDSLFAVRVMRWRGRWPKTSKHSINQHLGFCLHLPKIDAA